MDDGKFDLDSYLDRLAAMPPAERERVRREANARLREHFARVIADPWSDAATEDEIVRAVKEARAEIRAEKARAAAGRR